MKKLRLLVTMVMALLLVACADAQTIVKESSVTLGWDAPTVDTAGVPLLPGDVVSYKVYIEDALTGARTLVGETQAEEYAVTVPYRSTWRIGVSALLDGLESGIAWSTVAEDCEAGETFLLRPKTTPGKPGGLGVP